jgi:hypothetical protein
MWLFGINKKAEPPFIKAARLSIFNVHQRTRGFPSSGYPEFGFFLKPNLFAWITW